MRVTLDGGTDPRETERKQKAAHSASKAAAAVQSLTVEEVWAIYIAERRPHWGDLHYRDPIRKAAAGGVQYKRGTGTTEAGPLHDLMALPLRDLTAPVIETWATKQAKTRPTSARLAWRMLKVFLGWCEEQPAYAGLLPAKNPAKTKRSREALGKAGTNALCSFTADHPTAPHNARQKNRQTNDKPLGVFQPHQRHRTCY